jgi:hypothetical protein
MVVVAQLVRASVCGFAHFKINFFLQSFLRGLFLFSKSWLLTTYSDLEERELIQTYV